MSILSVNTKLNKGLSLGIKTLGIHFAPHKLSGKNVCPSASKGCVQSCLFTSGMGVYRTVKDARIKKTQYFLNDRNKFMFELKKEIETQIRRAKKNNMIPAFRLNLTSDIAWESIKLEGKNIMEHFPDVQFYDYVKNPKRMLNFLLGKFPKNYHLTFSRSESNDEHCQMVMKLGGNVAMVFEYKLPETYTGLPIVNGDDNDCRFLDPKGVIVGLKVKGAGKKDESGFVIRAV